MTDYSAGGGLTEAVTACQTALAILQRLGQSDQADGPLADAESSANYSGLDSDRDHSDAWKLQRYAQTYSTVVSTLARRLTSVANAAGTQDSEPPRHVRRLHFLGTAQDASRPPWSGKSCADVAFERCPGEHDWWVRVAVDPDFPLVLRACLGTWWWR